MSSSPSPSIPNELSLAEIAEHTLNETDPTFDMFYGGCGPHCDHLDFDPLAAPSNATEREGSCHHEPSAKDFQLDPESMQALGQLTGSSEAINEMLKSINMLSSDNLEIQVDATPVDKLKTVILTYSFVVAQLVSPLNLQGALLLIEDHMDHLRPYLTGQTSMTQALEHFHQAYAQIELLRMQFDKRVIVEELASRFYLAFLLNPQSVVEWVNSIKEETERNFYFDLLTRPCHAVGVITRAIQHRVGLLRERVESSVGSLLASEVHARVLALAHTLPGFPMVQSTFDQAQEVGRRAVDTAGHVATSTIQLPGRIITTMVTRPVENVLACGHQLYTRAIDQYVPSFIQSYIS